MNRNVYVALLFGGMLVPLTQSFSSGSMPGNGAEMGDGETVIPGATRSSTDSRGNYGFPASGEVADRIIEIKAGRKFINVTNGETILFKVNGKSFAWKFSTTRSHRSFDFSRIAPKDIDVRGIRVFCVPGLYERAG